MPSKTLITSRDPQGGQIMNLAEAALDNAGLFPDEAQYLITNGDRVKAELRKVLERIAVGCPVSCDAARAILGTNIWTVEDWQDVLGVSFVKAQLASVGEFPWGEKILTSECPFNAGKQVKDTHFAFLGIEKVDKDPLTILRMQHLFPATGQPRFYSYDDSWYKNQEFAKKQTCKLRWYLMLKEIVPGSESKTWDEQQSMLPPEYEVPEAVVDVAKHLLCSKKTGAPVNPDRYGRTSSLDSGGRRVVVGYCDPKGLGVSDSWDGRRYDHLGLSASRKLCT